MRVIESPTQTPIGNQILSALKPKRIEIISTGIDEALQGVGSTPFGGLSWTGLRIPTLATPPASPHLRYLFQLCAFQLSDGDTARIVGLRHGWSLGFLQAGPRIVEQWVNDPLYKGNDFNVSWHLRKLTLNEPRRAAPGLVIPTAALAPLQNFAFTTSDTPALLFQTATAAAGNPFYTALAAYTPPNLGRPWGRPLAGELGTFTDLKSRWNDAADWKALDIPVSGPCRVVFYASVKQSNIQTRQALVPPVPFLFQNGLSEEEQFLQDFPNAIPWRVAAALAIELEDMGQFRNYEVDGCK